MTSVTLALEQFVAALNAKFASIGYSFFVERPGVKYTRIVQSLHGNGRSVFCFVDAQGNIYKPAGWKTPAKGVRNGLDRVDINKVDPYGSWLYYNRIESQADVPVNNLADYTAYPDKAVAQAAALATIPNKTTDELAAAVATVKAGNAAKIKVAGHGTFRVAPNAYGNWYGYEGSKRTQFFFGDFVDQSFAAADWLAERVNASV